MPRCCLVALLSPPYASLTYSLPEWLPDGAVCEGMRVAVPLGNGVRTGVVVAMDAAPGVSEALLKPLWWPLERTPLLSRSYLEMMRQLSVRQMEHLGRILGSVLPVGLRKASARLRVFGGGRPRVIRLKDLRSMPVQELTRLGEEFLLGRVECLENLADAAEQEICSVASDPPWPVRPGAARQTELLEYLWEKGSVSRKKLTDDLGAKALAALRALVERGLVSVRGGEAGAESFCEGSEPGKEIGCSGNRKFQLTEAQRAALDGLRAAMLSDKGETALVFGVTGSGKTVVYLELARQCLESGKSVILLAPEVALAIKLRNDALRFLPEFPLYFSHGYQLPKTREAVFRELASRTAKSGGACLVVGTRSALFLPVPRLGAIILDEEHDSSFKQDEGLTYQAKEIAHYRIARERGVLVLGSATPDVRTFYAVRRKAIPAYSLERRVGGGELPELRLVDIRDRRPDEGILAPESAQALKEVVERGEQAVILLNRRGYAPLMYCLDCGATVKCPHCEIGLTYHKGRERLVCHYCGYSTPFPTPCPHCKGLNYLPMGEGTEKLEETLSTLLPPGTGVLRLDRDTSRRPGSMEEILAAFGRGEARVLVGTQMLSKGHHFPDVTLAIVADADLGLNLPDYRAAERTFQLLLQSAGRAGRGEKPGRVLVQTRDVHHFCWEFVKNGDYIGFYEREIALRQKRMYPPFVKLALVRFSFPLQSERGPALLNSLSKLLREKGKDAGVKVLGPAPAPMALLRGRKRYQCLLKADEWTALRRVYADILAELPSGSDLRVSLDMDPVNMM